MAERRVTSGHVEVVTQAVGQRRVTATSAQVVAYPVSTRFVTAGLVEVIAEPPLALTAPSGLTATAVSSTSIRCDWTDNSDNELNFELQYDTQPDFATANTIVLAANTVSHVVPGLLPATLYYFRVRATN